MNKHLIIINVDTDDTRRLIEVSHPSVTVKQFREDFAQAYAKAQREIEEGPAFTPEGSMILYPATWDAACATLEESTYGYTITAPEYSEVEA